MKVTEFLGRRVLDSNGMEVGRVSDLEIHPEKNLMISIIISTGDIWPKNKDIELSRDEIEAVGDYVILNIEKSKLEERVGSFEEKSEKKRKLMPE